jgi:hypothetical protein
MKFSKKGGSNKACTYNDFIFVLLKIQKCDMLTVKASSQLLGSFSGQIMLRELRRIPYLTWLWWFHALPVLGVTWGGQTQVGIARVGTYSETWMNLLLIFGAQNIITSSYIEHFPINSDDLPLDLANPFAVELGILAILVGITGCDFGDFQWPIASLLWR